MASSFTYSTSCSDMRWGRGGMGRIRKKEGTFAGMRIWGFWKCERAVQSYTNTHPTPHPTLHPPPPTWMMSRLVAPARPTLTVTGLTSADSANDLILAGMVALPYRGGGWGHGGAWVVGAWGGGEGQGVIQGHGQRGRPYPDSRNGMRVAAGPSPSATHDTHATQCPHAHTPEHEHLALAFEEGEHLADVLLKPQVHHAVGLVQAQVAANVKVHAPLAAQHSTAQHSTAQQSTGRGGAGRGGARRQ